MKWIAILFALLLTSVCSAVQDPSLGWVSDANIFSTFDDSAKTDWASKTPWSESGTKYAADYLASGGFMAAINYELTDTGSLTVSFWLRSQNTNQSSGVSGVADVFFVAVSNNSVSARLNGLVPNLWGSWETTNNVIQSNVWIHCIAVFDRGMSPDLEKVYLNGRANGTIVADVLTVGSIAPTTPVVLYVDATAQLAQPAVLLGDIDDFVIWKRAVTDVEAWQIYDESKARTKR